LPTSVVDLPLLELSVPATLERAPRAGERSPFAYQSRAPPEDSLNF
jgi:hypothetical protein